MLFCLLVFNCLYISDSMAKLNQIWFKLLLHVPTEVRSASSSQPTVGRYRRPLPAVPACAQATHWQGNELGMLLLFKTIHYAVYLPCQEYTLYTSTNSWLTKMHVLACSTSDLCCRRCRRYLVSYRLSAILFFY